MERLIKRINIYKISTKISDLFYSEETKNKKKFKLYVIHSWDFIKEISVMFFATYFLACLWYFYAKVVQTREHPQKSFYPYFSIDTFKPTNQFIITWYFIFTTITTVGYGDYYATNKYEMGFAIILLIMGPTWMAFTMGKAIAIINHMRQLSGKEYKKGSMNMWISNIEGKYKELPPELKQRITTHFLYYWKNDRLGTLANLSLENNEKLMDISDNHFNTLPDILKKELIQYLFDDIFYKFRTFFHIFDNIRHSEIYFKTAGIVQIGSMAYNTFKEFMIVKTNFIIGDYFAMQNIPSFADFNATSNVHGYTLPVFVLKEISKNQPELIEKAVKESYSYYQNIEKKSLENLTTNHLEEAEDSGRAFLEKGEAHEAAINCVLVNGCAKTIQDPMNQEIDKVSNGIDKMKTFRKKKFWELKEKLANHAISLQTRQ